jgi:hypothetical protein
LFFLGLVTFGLITFGLVTFGLVTFGLVFLFGENPTNVAADESLGI